MERFTRKTSTLMAAVAHLGTFAKYLFPLSNFFIPVVIGAIRNDDPFVNDNVKNSLNFQISLFLYLILISGMSIACALVFASGSPMGIHLDFDRFYISDGLFNLPLVIIACIAALLILGLLVLEIVSVITAALKASEGSTYKYPLTIPFLKPSNPSKNEQSNNNTKNETL